MSWTHLFPSRCTTLKIPESLRHLQRLDHDSFLFFIISDLGIPGHRVILPQRVTVKPVVRHNPPEIGMANEENPKQVVHLPLIPVRPVVKASDAWHRRSLIGICLNSYPRVVTHAEKIVDDFEPLISRGVVDGGYVHHRCILGCRVVLQERYDGEDARRRNVDGELVFPNRELLDVFWQAGEEVLTISVKTGGFLFVPIGGVDYGDMQLSGG